MNLYQATIFYLLLLVCVVTGFAVRELGEDEERGPEISITYGRSSSNQSNIVAGHYKLLKAIDHGKKREIKQFVSSLALTRQTGGIFLPWKLSIAYLKPTAKENHFKVYVLIPFTTPKDKDQQYYLETLRGSDVEILDNGKQMNIQNADLVRTLRFEKVEKKDEKKDDKAD